MCPKRSSKFFKITVAALVLGMAAAACRPDRDVPPADLASEGLKHLDTIYGPLRSLEAKRLAFLLLYDSGRKEEALDITIRSSLPASTYTDVRLRLIAKAPEEHIKAYAIRLKEMIHPGLRSPLLWTENGLLTEQWGGDMIGIADALGYEPGWEPALLVEARISASRSLHTAKALAVIDRGSETARDMLLQYLRTEEESHDTPTLARMALAKCEKSPPVLAFKAAAFLYHAGQTQEAADKYQEYVDAEERVPPRIYYGLSRAYAELGQTEAAEASLAEGLKIYPWTGLLLAEAARRELESGETDKALATLAKCIRASPEYPPAHVLLARIHSERGNLEETVEACGSAIGFSYRWPEQERFIRAAVSCLAVMADKVRAEAKRSRTRKN